MNYNENPASVRIDFFKESGKWYTTEAMLWTGEWQIQKQWLHEAFAQSLKEHFKGNLRMSGMFVVCLDPYHEGAYPLMGKVDDIINGQNGWEKS